MDSITTVIVTEGLPMASKDQENGIDSKNILLEFVFFLCASLQPQYN